MECLEITDRAAAEALGKPEGTYVTLFPEAFLRREEGAFEASAQLLGRLLRELLGLP